MLYSSQENKDSEGEMRSTVATVCPSEKWQKLSQFRLLQIYRAQDGHT